MGRVHFITGQITFALPQFCCQWVLSLTLPPTHIQAEEIVCNEKPPSGVYPSGLYHNSNKIVESFFTPAMRMARDKALTDRMPFLFRLLKTKLQVPIPASGQDASGDDYSNSEDHISMDPTDNLEQFDG